jgi:hypothetical protein
MNQREVTLVAACDAVNADPALTELIEEWQTVNDPIEEPSSQPATNY